MRSLLLLFCCSFTLLQAQSPVASRLLTDRWQAHWIDDGSAQAYDYGVYHFRKNFDLPVAPARFVVHVSADNRYQLFVNGRFASLGPQTSDPAHWRFESVDIAPMLRPGANTLAAVVWNFSEQRPGAQFTLRTAFVLQADDPAHHFVNTGASWRVRRNEAYSPEMQGIGALRSYYVAAPGERLDAERYPWGWEQPGFNDGAWAPARQVVLARPKGSGTEYLWELTPRTIPPMLRTDDTHIPLIRRSEDLRKGGAFALPEHGGLAGLRIPAHSEIKLLLDQWELVCAYPELRFSGGKGAEIRLTYAEALSRPGSPEDKGNRDEIAGKIIRGVQDLILPDGKPGRQFSPLLFRTWRYLELHIRTAGDALTLDNWKCLRTGYPLEARASFESSDDCLQPVWETGWRTAQRCAGETYFDCPYYEQLQYTGDTRIQALVSLYVSGDDRLARNAIQQFFESRLPEGINQSRYPSYKPQVIPPYSMFWVNMLHDYWMLRQDDAFVREKLGSVVEVMDWCLRDLDPKTGLYAANWHWNFTDWAFNVPENQQNEDWGVPEYRSGGSSILSLQLAYALEAAAELLTAYERRDDAFRFLEQAKALKVNAMLYCWDNERQLLADAPGKNWYSQHANIFAILTDAVPPARQRALMERTLADTTLVPCTFYFRFYLHQALQKTGMADRYLGLLKPWHDMIDLGLTTFAEQPDPTRSDCHAWSAAPNYDFLALVCGIRPAQPGFAAVRIEPALGSLQWVRGKMPHPAGMIEVFVEKKDGQLHGNVTLPDKLPATLIIGEQKFTWNTGGTHEF